MNIRNLNIIFSCVNILILAIQLIIFVYMIPHIYRRSALVFVIVFEKIIGINFFF